MHNSPDGYSYSQIRDVFNDNNCPSRLEGCHIDLQETYPLIPPLNGVAIEYRFEEHTSKDGTVKVQYDVYITEDGQEEKIIYTLEVDGAVYPALYDKPVPFAKNSTSIPKLK